MFWNGPLGEYEAGFDQERLLAQMLAECDAETVIGGRDSLAFVYKIRLARTLFVVSTGGGAMFEFLAK